MKIGCAELCSIGVTVISIGFISACITFSNEFRSYKISQKSKNSWVFLSLEGLSIHFTHKCMRNELNKMQEMIYNKIACEKFT